MLVDSDKESFYQRVSHTIYVSRPSRRRHRCHCGVNKLYENADIIERRVRQPAKDGRRFAFYLPRQVVIIFNMFSLIFLFFIIPVFIRVDLSSLKNRIKPRLPW